jgi:hypothetical protein
MGGGENEIGRLRAVAPTPSGWLYFSGALTAYDVENLYDQIVTLRSIDGTDIHVDVDLGGAPRNSPELRTLARRMKRLKRQGIVVRLHAARAPRRRASPTR